MSVILLESICHDCHCKSTCMKYKRINDMGDSRKFKDDRHKNDIFKVIIVECSIKNYDRQQEEKVAFTDGIIRDDDVGDDFKLDQGCLGEGGLCECNTHYSKKFTEGAQV